MLDTFAQHGLRELLHTPIPQVARALASFDRAQLGTAIEVMIAMLDAADGEVDAENGNDLEDDFVLTANAQGSDTGPGCAVADRDAGAYVEWHTKPSNLRRNGQAEILAGPEDAEEDDPWEANGDEHDSGNAEDELTAGVPPGFGSRGAGCSLADGDGDRSWAEWQSLSAATRRSGAIDGKPTNDWGQGVPEDAEDDDQDGCLAADDDPARHVSDGLPGDSCDTELNGDELDHSR